MRCRRRVARSIINLLSGFHRSLRALFYHEEKRIEVRSRIVEVRLKRADFIVVSDFGARGKVFFGKHRRHHLQIFHTFCNLARNASHDERHNNHIEKRKRKRNNMENAVKKFNFLVQPLGKPSDNGNQTIACKFERGNHVQISHLNDNRPQIAVLAVQ